MAHWEYMERRHNVSEKYKQGNSELGSIRWEKLSLHQHESFKGFTIMSTLCTLFVCFMLFCFFICHSSYVGSTFLILVPTCNIHSTTFNNSSFFFSDIFYADLNHIRVLFACHLEGLPSEVAFSAWWKPFTDKVN